MTKKPSILKIIENIKNRPHISINESTFINNQTKCEFIDSEYGSWITLPGSILAGCEHPKRAIKETSINKTTKIESILEKIKDRPYISINKDTYVNTKTKCEFIDSEYGSWLAKPISVIRGGNHPRRSIDMQSRNKIIPVETIEQRLPKRVSINRETYKGTGVRCEFFDVEYGGFWSTPYLVISGKKNHPTVSRLNKINSRKISIDEFKKRLPIHIKIKDDTYRDITTKCVFIDEKYGEWESKPSWVNNGREHPSRSCNGDSSDEICILDFIKSLGLWVEKRRFKKNNSSFEIDVFIENKMIGIEYNGLYWHSEEGIKRGRPGITNTNLNNYHHNKLLACKENNIRLIQIFEHEWENRQEQVRSFLRSSLGLNTVKLYARKLDFKSIDKKSAYDFLEKYHIQGNPHSSVLNIGVFNNDELVAVATFGRHHRNRSGIVLSRWCCMDNTTVTGALSKVSKIAIKELKVDRIISWSDNRWSTGNGYEASGWVKEADLPPDYFYWHKTKKTIHSKQSRRKSAVNTPKDMTEHEHALKDGLLRVYDAGKIRWIYTLPKQ